MTLYEGTAITLLAAVVAYEVFFSRTGSPLNRLGNPFRRLLAQRRKTGSLTFNRNGKGAR